MKALRGNISGLCQPTYVLDIPGGFGKAQLAESAISTSDNGEMQVLDYRGVKHSYADNICGFNPLSSEE